MNKPKRSTIESLIRRDLVVTPYENTNEVINRLMDEEDTVWIVQGNHGRFPIIADTEQQAKDRYVEKALYLYDLEKMVDLVTQAA